MRNFKSFGTAVILSRSFCSNAAVLQCATTHVVTKIAGCIANENNNSGKHYCRFILKRALSFCKTPADLVENRSILVRDFIHSVLYDPHFGYFVTRSGAVGLLDKAIPFGKLEGRSAYMKHLDFLYKKNDIAWFTPVELFKPWYGYSIAEAILRTTSLSTPLTIYEIGGGSGTCAKCILDYMKLNAPERVYDSINYISVEISPELAKKQVETVGQMRSHLEHFHVECRDASKETGWGGVDEKPCWVIMLEVLDNLPHDLIYRKDKVSSWMEVHLERNANEPFIVETYKSLQDPLIKKCVDVMEIQTNTVGWGAKTVNFVQGLTSRIFPVSQRAWVPTGCLQLFEVLHGALPKMSLIASDFSYLPDVKIAGERAPLVSCKKGGANKDYDSYLEAKGDADIFFPTDFSLLERIDHYCAEADSKLKDKATLRPIKKRRSTIIETANFIQEFGLPSKTRTKDGYNPLLDDFKNTKFYLSVPTYNVVRPR